jgi:hypothetical protein
LRASTFANLLPAVFAAVPDTNTQEIVDAIRWAIRESNLKGARLEAAMRMACKQRIARR